MHRRFLDGLGIGGYRSFSLEPVRLASLSEVNLVAGQNNSGKSNLLRFLFKHYEQCVAATNSRRDLDLNRLDHFGLDAHADIVFEVAVVLGSHLYEQLVNSILSRVQPPSRHLIPPLLETLFSSPPLYDGEACWWRYRLKEGDHFVFDADFLKEASDSLGTSWWNQIWRTLSGRSGGYAPTWVDESLRFLSPVNLEPPPIKSLPAFRQIQEGHDQDDLSGIGLVDRLARLQNPDVLDRHLRESFEKINRFVQSVFERPDARLEVPYARDVILVHLGDLRLPVASLGTGFHEVVILATAATVLEDQVICIEEPELHLHPLLQRKLLQYLATETTNQYVIATHSAHLLDSATSSIFHVRHDGSASRVSKVLGAGQRADLCYDLGYRASDILQSNVVVWVEGPSDRLYLRHWVADVAPDLVEGIDYSIMFYGGRLLSHLSAHDPEVDEFISLRRLNRNMVVIMDSDKSSPHKRLNATKRRVESELELGGGVAWVTNGREIENYIPPALMLESLKEIVPTALALANVDAGYRFGRAYEFRESSRGRSSDQVDKVALARAVVNRPADLTQLDLRKRVRQLVAYISAANGREGREAGHP